MSALPQFPPEYRERFVSKGLWLDRTLHDYFAEAVEHFGSVVTTSPQRFRPGPQVHHHGTDILLLHLCEATSELFVTGFYDTLYGVMPFLCCVAFLTGVGTFERRISYLTPRYGVVGEVFSHWFMF